jgi:hypothetical protein
MFAADAAPLRQCTDSEIEISTVSLSHGLGWGRLCNADHDPAAHGLAPPPRLLCPFRVSAPPCTGPSASQHARCLCSSGRELRALRARSPGIVATVTYRMQLQSVTWVGPLGQKLSWFSQTRPRLRANGGLRSGSRTCKVTARSHGPRSPGSCAPVSTAHAPGDANTRIREPVHSSRLRRPAVG